MKVGELCRLPGNLTLMITVQKSLSAWQKQTKKKKNMIAWKENFKVSDETFLAFNVTAATSAKCEWNCMFSVFMPISIWWIASSNTRDVILMIYVNSLAAKKNSIWMEGGFIQVSGLLYSLKKHAIQLETFCGCEGALQYVRWKLAPAR